MGDLLPFRSDIGLVETQGEGLLNAAIDVLNTNTKLALAIQETADRFLRLERAMNAADASCEGSIAERIRMQDSHRVFDSMRELLESISEYADGVRHNLSELQ